jgi:hypothetical protein
MTEEKIKENRLRRQLARMGYHLHKSRLRDAKAVGYGGYLITDKWTNAVVAGGHPYAYCMTIAAVEKFANKAKPSFPKGGGKK